MLIISKSKVEIDRLKAQLSLEFDMKDLGEAKKILGMEIKRDRAKGIICLTQTQYLKTVLQRFCIDSKSKPVSTPLAPHFKLSALMSPNTDDAKRQMDHVPYANVVGALMYAMPLHVMGEAGKDFNPQHDKCITHAYLPWSGEMRLVESDSDLLEVFYQFGQHDTYIIHFDMEPLSLNGQPHTTPILQSSDDVDVFVEQERGSGSEEDDKDEMSDIESEDEPQTPIRSSDDDGDTDKSAHSGQIRGRVFRENQGGRITLEVGMLFNDLEHFRQVISDYVIQEGFDLDRVKNEKSWWIGKCKGANGNYTWRIHASPVINHFTYQIKSFNNTHICNRQTKRLEVTATWIAQKYETFIMENPDIKISILATELLKDYKVAVSEQKLYRARTIALEGSNENHKESYNKFWKYGNIVRIKNQGSVTMLNLHQPLPGGPQHFLRFFLSFEAQKYGYLAGCRPFIGIDGCHLKNRYGGMLLSAVGIDANCGMFPIAVCICEEETSESWGWFLEHLYWHLHVEGRRMPCFMSDR
ncbi:hypothetical protein EZV62_010120 [Acer yangbiense]|uniref:Reverse transcriptase Ty1/copia-type domain-containing protein n=1 Tax=Acer yangbiense TaxID=1000413 RepID=A0A5C7I3F6_9ROSI|nr:hypothetical protein EZV62_010120 [Acer yangbiense]